MEPKNNEGFEFELELVIEELEQKIAPGDTGFPFPAAYAWGGRGW